MARTALIKSTNASIQDCSMYSTVSGISITASTPDGTSMKFVVSLNGGEWKHYNTSSGAWESVATQDITADSVMAEGNTKAELESLVSSKLGDFAGATVAWAVGMQMEDTAENSPSIASIQINGQSGSTVTEASVECAPINLSDSGGAVDILSINVNKSEQQKGTVRVVASIQDESGAWGEYKDYEAFVTSPPTAAKAIEFKAILTTPTPGTDVATINSVTISHRTDNVAVFSEGTGVCVTQTHNFVNNIGRAHLMVKHPIVADTEIKAYVSLRKQPSYVYGEVIGTGDGQKHTVKLAHTEGLASHGFVLYFDGVAQAASTYSFSPSDGQVTYTAPEGEPVTVDYIHGWSKEEWVEMKHDTQYPDKNDNNSVDDQFDYLAGEGDPTGSVGAVKVALTQNTGTVKNAELGIGTGEQQSFKLPHHAKAETIVVSPAEATWKWRDNTDVLLISAPKGEPITVSYSWAARTNYLESIACVFNE